MPHCPGALKTSGGVVKNLKGHNHTPSYGQIEVDQHMERLKSVAPGETTPGQIMDKIHLNWAMSEAVAVYSGRGLEEGNIKKSK